MSSLIFPFSLQLLKAVKDFFFSGFCFYKNISPINVQHLYQNRAFLFFNFLANSLINNQK